MDEMEKIMRILAKRGYQVSVTCYPHAEEHLFGVCVFGRGEWFANKPLSVLRLFEMLNRLPGQAASNG